jgi:hypothetical protein
MLKRLFHELKLVHHIKYICDLKCYFYITWPQYDKIYVDVVLYTPEIMITSNGFYNGFSN